MARTPAEALRRQIVEALSKNRFSARLPSASELSTAGWLAQASREGCLDVTLDNVASCRSGSSDAPLTAVVLGDEAAISYLPMIRSALATQFSIQQLTFRGCPVWSAPVLNQDGTLAATCEKFRDASSKEVARLRPDLLILASSYQQAGRLASGATGDVALEEVRAGYDEAMSSLTSSARFTVVLPPPPGGRSLSSCLVDGSAPAACASAPPFYYGPFVRMEGGVARDHEAMFISTLGWFCAAGRCPAAVGARAVYADGQRVTADYARSLSKVFDEALTALADKASQR